MIDVAAFLDGELEKIDKLMQKPRQNINTCREIDARLDLLERLVSRIEVILRQKKEVIE